MTDLTVIILTMNEARHIRRAIASVRDVATRILVVDSGSEDDTAALAKAAGAEVMYHPWTTHAAQFNWALDQIAGVPGWVLRLDADEVLTPALSAEIAAGLPDVAGLHLRRRIWFMGQPVRYGGVFPVQVMRLFRNGAGRCEDRWMDEHIVVDGPTATLQGELIDNNLNPLDWWIAKHNQYASREVIDILNARYGLLPQGQGLQQGGLKRWVKTVIYGRLPPGLRAGAYFFYRFVLRLGLLDGSHARAFHVLQGFWYRYLVDAKLAEVTGYIAETGAPPDLAIRCVLGVDLALYHHQQREDAA